MPRTETEQLVFSVEARIAAMEKQMARAGRVTDKTMTDIERRGKTMTGRLEKTMAASASRVSGLMKSFGVGFLGGLTAGGVAGIVGQLGSVANGIAQIGDEAKRAGVSATVFQEWKYVAQQNRIGIDQMTDGLKELNLRADEFVQTGNGSAAEAFQRLGYSAADLKTKLQDPSALLLEIIDRLGKFDKAAQIRISDELFGGSAGERFVELIDQGTDGIKATIQQAHNLNAVLDDEVIASAAELDRRFNAVATTVGSTLKSAIVSAAESLTDFINAFRGFEFERTAKLGDRMASLGKERLDVERQVLELKDRQRRGEGVGDGIFGTSLGESTALEAMADYQRRLEAIGAEEQMIGKIIDERRVAKPAASTWTPPPPPPGGFGGSSSSGGRGHGASRANREADAVHRLIAEMEEELRLVGATDEEKRASNILRKAGAAATDEERQRLVALNEALYQNEEAQHRAKEAATFFQDAFSDAFSDLLPKIETGNDALDRFVNTLVEAVAQAALLGKGPLSGMFGGGIFGGKGLLGGTVIPGILHDGGVAGTDGYRHGKAYAASTWAGARRYHSGGIAGLQPGEIPTILQRGELVLPKGILRGHDSVAPITIHTVINADGADAAALMRVQRSVDDLRKAVPAMVQNTVHRTQVRKTRA